jgi:hypothetical protein
VRWSGRLLLCAETRNCCSRSAKQSATWAFTCWLLQPLSYSFSLRWLTRAPRHSPRLPVCIALTNKQNKTINKRTPLATIRRLVYDVPVDADSTHGDSFQLYVPFFFAF